MGIRYNTMVLRTSTSDTERYRQAILLVRALMRDTEARWTMGRHGGQSAQSSRTMPGRMNAPEGSIVPVGASSSTASGSSSGSACVAVRARSDDMLMLAVVVTRQKPGSAPHSHQQRHDCALAAGRFCLRAEQASVSKPSEPSEREPPQIT